jgi:hypothetical protein
MAVLIILITLLLTSCLATAFFLRLGGMWANIPNVTFGRALAATILMWPVLLIADIGLRVLVVEDDPDCASSTAMLLTATGHEARPGRTAPPA